VGVGVGDLTPAGRQWLPATWRDHPRSWRCRRRSLLPLQWTPI